MSSCVRGKLRGDLGADVIVANRAAAIGRETIGPYVAEPDPEQSLWWWHYNTANGASSSILETRPRTRLVSPARERADVVLEAASPGDAALGIDYDDCVPRFRVS